jgi:hypothetical protein
MISLLNTVISREYLLSLILLLAPVTPNGTTSVDLDTILLMGIETFPAKGRVAVIAKSMNRPGPSIKYNSLNEGKAIAIKIRDGVIVQTNSKIVNTYLSLCFKLPPCFKVVL